MNSQTETIKKWLGHGSINLFGMPFAGKDTQALALSNLLDAPVLGGGQILRESDIPTQVREIMQRGELIPTDDYLRIVLPYLSKKEFTNKPLLLSSLGRWNGEQEGVMLATSESGHAIKAVVLLRLTEAQAKQRWQIAKTNRTRGDRADDSEASFTLRFDEFRNKTMPVIEFYKKQGLLIEVDGSPDEATVTTSIISALVRKCS